MKKTDFIKVTCAAVITAAVLTGCGSTAAGSATSNAAMTQASAYTPEQPQVTEDGSNLGSNCHAKPAMVYQAAHYKVCSLILFLETYRSIGFYDGKAGTILWKMFM